MPDPTASDFPLPALDARSLARRLGLPIALAAAAAITVVVMSSRVPTVAGVLRRALGINPIWVAMAIGLEVLSLAGYVVLLAFVAGRATPRVRMRESAQITLAGAAATRLLPTAGAGGAALTLFALRRAGLTSRDAVRTLLAFLVLLYSVFLASIVASGAALSLGLVRTRGPATLSAIPAGAALLGIAACLLLAHRHRDAAGEPRDGGADGGRPGRVKRGGRLIGLAVRDACRLVGRRDRRLAGAIAYWAFDAGVLWAMLHAFGAPPVLPVLALAYLVGQVANTLPLPGSVSGGIAGGLIAFGVPAELALASVLAYRTVAVWLPTPIAIAAVPGLRATIGRWERDAQGRRARPMDCDATAKASGTGLTHRRRSSSSSNPASAIAVTVSRAV